MPQRYLGHQFYFTHIMVCKIRCLNFSKGNKKLKKFKGCCSLWKLLVFFATGCMHQVRIQLSRIKGKTDISVACKRFYLSGNEKSRVSQGVQCWHRLYDGTFCHGAPPSHRELVNSWSQDGSYSTSLNLCSRNKGDWKRQKVNRQACQVCPILNDLLEASTENFLSNSLVKTVSHGRQLVTRKVRKSRVFLAGQLTHPIKLALCQ